MPRIARIALPNYPHHLVQRGHNQRDVFFCDADRVAYLDTLAEFREALGLKIYGYCLMTNHVHLIVNPGDDEKNLGRLMKRLAGRHTRRINRAKQRSGTLWGGRFKCSGIETDRYLLACLRYVDLNPVRARMVARAADYRWSSYRTHIGVMSSDWLDVDPVTLALSGDPARRCERYRSFVAEGENELELKLIRAAVQRGQLTGSDQFIESIESRLGRAVSKNGPGKPF